MDAIEGSLKARGIDFHSEVIFQDSTISRIVGLQLFHVAIVLDERHYIPENSTGAFIRELANRSGGSVEAIGQCLGAHFEAASGSQFAFGSAFDDTPLGRLESCVVSDLLLCIDSSSKGEQQTYMLTKLAVGLYWDLIHDQAKSFIAFIFDDHEFVAQIVGNPEND